MAVKHRHLPLAAFILAIGAFAGSPSAGANLAIGETRLPSGVVVRFDDAASSAEELRRTLEEKSGATAEERRKTIEVLKSAVLAERRELKLEIINALNHTIQSICDEYVNYAFKPYGTPPPSLKEVVIDVSDRQSQRSEGKCVYKVAQNSKITREDGSPLLDIALEKVQLDDSNSITIASLSERNEVLTQHPVKDILIAVPFGTTGILDLAPYLTRAAQKLYSDPAYKGTIINFLVAEKSVQEDTYSLPSLRVMAFTTAPGSVALVSLINFQRVGIGRQDNQPREIIAISAWNFNLAKAIAAGLNSEAYKDYSSEGVFRDSTEIFDAVGRYAAEAFKVSQVIISHEAPLPGGKAWFRVPIVVEFDNGVWRIANKRN
jgi:hypothetical protein